MLFTWKQILSFKESVVSYYLPTIFACVQCRFRFSYQIFGSVTRDLYFDYISSCLMTQSNQFVPWQLWSIFGSEALLVSITILSRPVWNMLFTWKQILSFIESVCYYPLQLRDIWFGHKRPMFRLHFVVFDDSIESVCSLAFVVYLSPLDLTPSLYNSRYIEIQ